MTSFVDSGFSGVFGGFFVDDNILPVCCLFVTYSHIDIIVVLVVVVNDILLHKNIVNYLKSK